jgi:uncharacterized protein
MLTRRTRPEETIEHSSAAVEVGKDETTRLYKALTDSRVIGTLAHEATCARVTLTHSLVDPDQRHRVMRRVLARHSLEDLS